MAKNTSERWQNKINSLRQGIHKIYETKEFYDVVFTVDGKDFKGHKLVLAARSAELARILLDPNCPEKIIVESDSVTETGFGILLCFIYKDTLGTQDKQSIVKAFLAANHYKQSKLMDKCEEEMGKWSISIDEACELFNVSLSIPTLNEKCLSFIKTNATDVITSPTFLKLTYKALAIILEKDAFKDVPLKKRIERVVEWSAHQHTTPVDYALVRDDLLNNQPPLLGQLELQKLKIEDFNGLFVVKYRNLLMADEILSFLTYFTTNDKSCLPSWCIAS